VRARCCEVYLRRFENAGTDASLKDSCLTSYGRFLVLESHCINVRVQITVSGSLVQSVSYCTKITQYMMRFLTLVPFQYRGLSCGCSVLGNIRLDAEVLLV
jgi:hypothetical protein